jgi:hypothetical protein
MVETTFMVNSLIPHVLKSERPSILIVIPMMIPSPRKWSANGYGPLFDIYIYNYIIIYIRVCVGMRVKI